MDETHPRARNPRPLRAARALTLLAAFAALIPAPAAAQPGKPGKPAAPTGPTPLSQTLTGMARAEYEAGKILYQDGDFANALVKFQHAFDLSKDPRLLWNVLVCEKNLRHYTRVLSLAERYLKEGGDLLTAEDRKDADELIKTVRTLVSSVTLEVTEPGADVFIDDEKIGTSPLTGPLIVDVGVRKLRAVKPGFKIASRTETLVGATAVTVRLTLEKEVHEGRLVVDAGPKDAIFIDGKVVATGHWEGVLASGGHTLRITAPGKTAYQAEVTIADTQTRRIPVTLTPLKSAFPLGWVLGGAGVLVAGGVTAAIIVATRPSAPDARNETIAPGVVPVGFSFGGRR